MIKVSIQVKGVETNGQILADDASADVWVKKNAKDFPAGYVVVKTDVTSQVSSRKNQAKFLARQSAGSLIIAKMYSILNDNNISPALFLTFLADTKISSAERMLRNGILPKAKTFIQSFDTTYFTAAQNTEFASDIDNYLATETP